MRKWFLIILLVNIIACAGNGRDDDKRIGNLNKEKVEVKEPIIKDSLEKAMAGYRKFLEEVPETDVTPEAMRRLADLQLEAGDETDSKSEKTVAENKKNNIKEMLQTPQQRLAEKNANAEAVKQKTIDPEKFGKTVVTSSIFTPSAPSESDADGEGVGNESLANFESRATGNSTVKSSDQKSALPDGIDKEQIVITNTNTEEAILLYRDLLKKFPLYDRNDQVLYQLARAYEEGGRQEEAMDVLTQLIKKYPQSVHYDEAQFRRAEIFFVRKKYYSAEQAYQSVLDIGSSSAFYDQSLFKQGWSYFKQSMFSEGLDDFITLLDIKTGQGYHLNPEGNKTEYQRMLDTYRVVSLSFSYMGGPNAIASYFQMRGNREYEDDIYSYLGEHYLQKRRYQDAAGSYNSFLGLYPLHERAPEFNMRVMEIYKKGNFPILVIEAKKAFAEKYHLQSQYWTYHDIKEYPEILDFIKNNLVDLAKHYHALSQSKRKPIEKNAAYLEAVKWYRAFLASFPEDEQASGLNFLLAEILFDNKNYKDAALEYEKTSYAYAVHEHSSESGYAAILAYREYEKKLSGSEKDTVHLELIRSSLQFSDSYPSHKNAPAVLVNAAENLFALNEFSHARDTAKKVIEQHQGSGKKLIISSWTIIAHASFDLESYEEAEQGYQQVLNLISNKDLRVKPMQDRIAASIYKQAELHQVGNNLDAAVEDFLRIGKIAPQSKIRVSAEYDAASALIVLKKWDYAAEVLTAFRKRYPGNELQSDVTKKLAVVYQEDGKFLKAAKEYETISNFSKGTDVGKQGMLLAADLYQKADANQDALRIYRKYVQQYPKPLDIAQESRQKLAGLYNKLGNQKKYISTLKEIVQAHKKIGSEANLRSKYLAANAAFDLTEPLFISFKNARLGEPFQKTLKIKKAKMQKAIAAYSDLVDYGVPDVLAASTYKIADIYYQFSIDLIQSERPKNLSVDELEQYELILEEQAYPFEEKAIGIYEKNMELLGNGVYNAWIDKSIDKLAILLPARYDKKEQGEQIAVNIY